MNNNYNGNRGNQRPNGQNAPQRPQPNRRPVQQNPNVNSQRSQNPRSQGNYRTPQYQPYPPVRHRSRKQAKKSLIMLVLAVVIAVMLIVSAVIFIVRLTRGFSGGTVDGTSGAIAGTTDTTASAADTEPPVTETEELALTYMYVEKSAEDVYKGYQLLVNYDNAYKFNGGFELETLYSNKNGFFKVRNITDSLDARAMQNFCDMMATLGADLGYNDIYVSSSNRTMQEQEAIYNSRVDQYGEEYAQLYVAVPGHSEHHTGLALDLAIIDGGGKAFTFDDKPEYPEWLRENAHKFGFIERYQAEKVAITKIAYENWHYRYIGRPHAYYINQNKLCLEEYIDLLRAYTFRGEHLEIADDYGASWEIYFVAADASGTTKIPVPKYMEYEISGNNVDGFIVTIKK